MKTLCASSSAPMGGRDEGSAVGAPIGCSSSTLSESIIVALAASRCAAQTGLF